MDLGGIYVPTALGTSPKTIDGVSLLAGMIRFGYASIRVTVQKR